jgi:uncharacterized protein (DUF2236 family)
MAGPSNPLEPPLAVVRDRLGAWIMRLVAGREPQRPIGLTADSALRRFPDGSPITVVHSDASMFVGGLAALLLQSLHPLAMAGVAEHSDYRHDPWGRLSRTSTFLAHTTFGTRDEATRAVATVRAVHRRVRGIAPDGRRYAASDPHLLAWVHLAELVCFLAAHRRYGRHSLTPDEADRYVAQAGEIARELGAAVVPATVAELHAQLDGYRPELRGTPEARAVARYLVFDPPLPLAARAAYAPIAAAAVGLLPRWARWPLHLPWLPVTEATLGRAAGRAITRTIRWSLSGPRP